jgi:hypothetical protein
MKQFFILVVLFELTMVHAQSISGVYLSPGDLASNKLSFKAASKKCKVKLHEFPYRSHIHVKYGDSTYVLEKDSVFGYKDLSGTSYRFSGKKIYKIINPTETILIYETTGQGDNPKDMRVYTYYSFSKNASTPIKNLTISTLLNSFKENNVFVDLVEEYFRTDEQLTEYDPVHKQYKINHLFELSKKQ